MKKKKTSPFIRDQYRSRGKRVKQLYSPGSVYEMNLFASLAVFVFVIIDFYCLKVVWNLVQLEDPFYINAIALACAIALDVPLAIAAIALKKYDDGFIPKKDRNLILILSIAVFSIAFVFSFAFRIVTKDLSFEIGTASTMTETLASTDATSSDSTAIWVAAMFNSVIPLLTSLSSFVISYFSCNLIVKKLLKYEKERIGLQSNCVDAEKALTEMEGSKEYNDRLIKREKELYKEFMDELDTQALLLKQRVRVIIMEKLNNPEDITALSRSSESLANRHKASFNLEQSPVNPQNNQDDEPFKAVVNY